MEGLADKLNSEQKGVTLLLFGRLPPVHRGRLNLVHCFIRALAFGGLQALPPTNRHLKAEISTASGMDAKQIIDNSETIHREGRE
jgi:hypothetical protein